MTAPGDFSSGDVLTAGDMNGLPAGLLDTSTGGDVTVTTSTTDVTSVTFTLPSTRNVMIAVNVGQIDSVSADTNCFLTVQDTNAAGTPSQIYHRSLVMCLNGSNTSASGFNVRNLSAGTHTLYLVAETSTGSVRLNEVGSQDALNRLAVFDVGE